MISRTPNSGGGVKTKIKPKVRHFMTKGVAQAHLHRWIAAASTLQHAWRAALFRRHILISRGLRAGLLYRVVRIQACWRGMKARLAFMRLRHAALVLQVCLFQERNESYNCKLTLNSFPSICINGYRTECVPLFFLP
jgi:hypothetical protein